MLLAKLIYELSIKRITVVIGNIEAVEDNKKKIKDIGWYWAICKNEIVFTCWLVEIDAIANGRFEIWEENQKVVALALQFV